MILISNTSGERKMCLWTAYQVKMPKSMRTMTVKSQNMSMENQFVTLIKIQYVVLTVIKM